MNTETVVAAPSAETPDVFNGETPSLAEYSHYRATGELPERFKPAETVADPAPAEDVQQSSGSDELETAADSETAQEQQEKPGKKRQTAEERIAQLESTIEKIKRGAGLERKAEVAPVTEQPKQAPQNYGEWRKSFKPSEWIQDFAKKNPEATYEDANAAMADYLGDVRDQFKAVEQQRESQAREMNARIADAKARYGENYDDVVKPTVETIIADNAISPEIKRMINESDVVADLVFTLGSDEKTLNEFLSLAKTQPGKAVRYLALVENGIVEELAGATKAATETRNEKGQFTAPPAKQKTSAPKPPAPVTGVSTGAFDVSDESLSPEEWMRKRNADLAKKRG